MLVITLTLPDDALWRTMDAEDAYWYLLSERRKRRRLAREAVKATGVLTCLKCDSPALPDRVHCDPCRLKHNANARRRYRQQQSNIIAKDLRRFRRPPGNREGAVNRACKNVDSGDGRRYGLLPFHRRWLERDGAAGHEGRGTLHFARQWEDVAARPAGCVSPDAGSADVSTGPGNRRRVGVPRTIEGDADDGRNETESTVRSNHLKPRAEDGADVTDAKFFLQSEAEITISLAGGLRCDGVRSYASGTGRWRRKHAGWP